MTDHYNTISFSTGDLSSGRPMIAVSILGAHGRWTEVEMLADSGNDITLINLETARRLGFTDCHEHIDVAGISGAPQKFCIHRVQMRIGNSRPITIRVGVGDLDDNLLGREGVFDKFDISFRKHGIEFQQRDLIPICIGCSNSV